MNPIDIIVASFERQQLPIFTIRGVNIGTQEATAIAAAIQRNRLVLTILNLEYCKFQSENELDVILQAIKYSDIVSLSFEGSLQANSKEPKVLAAFVRETTTLQSLDLTDCHIQFALGVLMDAMEVNTSIKLLNLKRNKLQRAAPILFALQENSTLEVLHLEDNHLSRREMTAILRLIEKRGVIHSIFLQNNDGSQMPLSKFDKHTPYHFDLNLENLGISLRRSNRSLASFLAKTTTLSSLKVTCYFANEFLSISKALKKNTSLTHLELFFRAHCAENIDILLEALCQLSFYKICLTLDFTLSPLSTAELEKIITLIQTNLSVRFLKIINHQWLDEHAIRLARALAVNESLKQCHIVASQMTMMSHQAFATALNENERLIVFTNTAMQPGSRKIYGDNVKKTNLVNISFSQVVDARELGAETSFYPPGFGLRNLVTANQARFLQEISEFIDNLTLDAIEENTKLVEICLEEIITCPALTLLHAKVAKKYSNQLAIYYLNQGDLTQAFASYESPYVDKKQLSIDIASWIIGNLQPDNDHSKLNPVLQYYFTSERRPHLYALNWKMTLVLLHPYFEDAAIQVRLQEVAMNLRLPPTNERVGGLVDTSLSKEQIMIVSKEFIHMLILEIADFDLVKRKLISEYFLQLRPAALHSFFQMTAIKTALQRKLGTSNVIVADHLLTHPLDFPIKEATVVYGSIDEVVLLLDSTSDVTNVMAESKRNFLCQYHEYKRQYEVIENQLNIEMQAELKSIFSNIAFWRSCTQSTLLFKEILDLDTEEEFNYANLKARALVVRKMPKGLFQHENLAYSLFGAIARCDDFHALKQDRAYGRVRSIFKEYVEASKEGLRSRL